MEQRFHRKTQVMQQFGNFKKKRKALHQNYLIDQRLFVIDCNVKLINRQIIILGLELTSK